MEGCPKCGSPHPDMHPSIEEGVETAYICPDSFHSKPKVGTGITRWADRAQYTSEPATSTRPVVTLLNATPDPLGSVAALTAMYKGRVVRNLAFLTDDERREAFADMQKTELSGALEAVNFQFLVENVSRSWTHQAVRTRQAFFAQESMRFAVVEDWSNRIPNPPGFEQWPAEAQQMWVSQLKDAENVYNFLVDSGVPAEDARGLMPHAITTRLSVVMDLRTLLHQAGLRLCTQAQFEWKLVMAGMVNAVRRHHQGKDSSGEWRDADHWQFAMIADALRPVCYQQGRCTFMASMDRGCTIRPRVNANAEIGRPSSDWHMDGFSTERGTRGYFHDGVQRSTKGVPVAILAIQPAEWAADPGAARADGGGFIGDGAK